MACLPNIRISDNWTLLSKGNGRGWRLIVDSQPLPVLALTAIYLMSYEVWIRDGKEESR